jgi:uncharacterized membrane protein YcaP (DUF421 family)
VTAVLATHLFRLGVPAWELIIRSAAIYLFLIVALRVFGKREIGQFTVYDLVLILLVANAVQPAMTGPDASLGGGMIIIATLVGLNLLIARADRYRLFHRLLSPAPSLIIKDGQLLPGPLRREGVSPEEVEMAIREHGLSDVSEVKIGVLEEDGTISIVPTSSPSTRTRRRVRYQRHG